MSSYIITKDLDDVLETKDFTNSLFAALVSTSRLSNNVIRNIADTMIF